jgi:histidinol-phosphate/aromatic aminotransferase/cobyric acid decarboxylase-like protein
MSSVDSVLKLVRPDILALTAYSSARKESKGGRVWLDANENPQTPSAAKPLLNRYPEPQPADLVAQLATLYGVTPAQVLVTRGSDEGIDLLLRTFCRAGQDAILITPPTYGMYVVAAGIQGARTVTVPLIREKNFALDAAAVLQAVTPAVKLVFLCSPNNPTGGLLDRTAVMSLVKSLAARAVVVVDEAYVDFSGQPSLAAEIPANPNLVVLRTLSKAYGLAGARVGTTLADPAVIAVLQKVIAPCFRRHAGRRARPPRCGPAQAARRQTCLAERRQLSARRGRRFREDDGRRPRRGRRLARPQQGRPASHPHHRRHRRGKQRHPGGFVPCLTAPCHCEERSDEAIQLAGSPRPASPVSR